MIMDAMALLIAMHQRLYQPLYLLLLTCCYAVTLVLARSIAAVLCSWCALARFACVYMSVLFCGRVSMPHACMNACMPMHATVEHTRWTITPLARAFCSL